MEKAGGEQGRGGWPWGGMGPGGDGTSLRELGCILIPPPEQPGVIHRTAGFVPVIEVAAVLNRVRENHSPYSELHFLSHLLQGRIG